MENLVKVKDMFMIYQRLKDIDPSYTLCFNKENFKYEVYCFKNGKLEYAFTSPYDSVDNRLLLYAKRTRIERIDEILEEIEENNDKLCKDEEEIKTQKPKAKLESIINYLKKRWKYEGYRLYFRS